MDNQTSTSNEVDLHYVGQKVKGYVSQINDNFFDFILFVKRNIILFAVVMLLGAAYGYYIDSQAKLYSHKVILIPNFESVDYLYEEAEKLNAKIADRDYEYLKSIGIKNPNYLAKVTVEPIIDIYDFIDDVELYETNDKKFDLFKLISESGDMKSILKEHSTSKNYKYHVLELYTVNKADEAGYLQPVLDHLNSNKYFVKIQEGMIRNLDIKIAQNDTLIKQMDRILSDFSSFTKGTATNLTYFHSETDLGDIIIIKERTIAKKDQYLEDKVNFENVFKDMGKITNVRYKTGLTGLMKFVMPVVFFVILCGILFAIAYYKRQVRNRKALTQNI